MIWMIKCYHAVLFRNLRFSKLNGVTNFREWQDQNALKIGAIEPGRLFKGEDSGVDMQELTESIANMNAKCL